MSKIFYEKILRSLKVPKVLRHYKTEKNELQTHAKWVVLQTSHWMKEDPHASYIIPLTCHKEEAKLTSDEGSQKKGPLPVRVLTGKGHKGAFWSTGKILRPDLGWPCGCLYTQSHWAIRLRWEHFTVSYAIPQNLIKNLKRKKKSHHWPRLETLCTGSG